MTKKIQIVENSDRFHVSVDGVPEATFLFGPSWNETRDQALLDAEECQDLTLRIIADDGYSVKILPLEKK